MKCNFIKSSSNFNENIMCSKEMKQNWGGGDIEECYKFLRNWTFNTWHGTTTLTAAYIVYVFVCNIYSHMSLCVTCLTKSFLANTFNEYILMWNWVCCSNKEFLHWYYRAMGKTATKLSHRSIFIIVCCLHPSNLIRPYWVIICNLYTHLCTIYKYERISMLCT